MDRPRWSSSRFPGSHNPPLPQSHPACIFDHIRTITSRYFFGRRFADQCPMQRKSTQPLSPHAWSGSEERAALDVMLQIRGYRRHRASSPRLLRATRPRCAPPRAASTPSLRSTLPTRTGVSAVSTPTEARRPLPSITAPPRPTPPRSRPSRQTGRRASTSEWLSLPEATQRLRGAPSAKLLRKRTESISGMRLRLRGASGISGGRRGCGGCLRRGILLRDSPGRQGRVINGALRGQALTTRRYWSRWICGC